MSKRKTLTPTFPGGHTYKWAHLERLRTYRAPVMGVDHLGEPYVADSAGGPWQWDLRCACGYEWTILEDDFPGKRRLRSCGRPECPHGQPDRPPRKPREPKSVRGVNMDLSLIELVNQYAGKHGISFSAAINEMLHAYHQLISNTPENP